METIITAAMVLGMYFNANVNANAQSVDNAVIQQKVAQKTECRCKYDEQGRLANKETLSWDEAKKEWQNMTGNWTGVKGGTMETKKWIREAFRR